MRSRQQALLVAIAVSALVSAGCTSTENGSPTAPGGVPTSEAPTSGATTGSTEPTDPGPSESAGSELPSDGAPRVADPLTFDKFLEQPCLTLTQAQLTGFGVRPEGERRTDATGLTCQWRNDNNGAITVSIPAANKRGLSGIYRAEKDGRYKYFEPVGDIGGYPAVAASVVDLRESGACILNIGVRDELALVMQLSQSLDRIGKADPCEVAVTVGEAIVTTVKAG